jgi:hypothetical protein
MAEALPFGNSPRFKGVNHVHVHFPDGIAPGPDVGVRTCAEIGLESDSALLRLNARVEDSCLDSRTACQIREVTR